MTNHGRRSPARFLAPLALLVVVAAVLVTISNAGLGDDSGNKTGASTKEQTSVPKKQATTPERKRLRRTYTIKTGDTLGAIAEKTGVSVARLQELNPSLDPQALVAGQKIKLRE
jgi:LysM repeat protein